MNKFNIDSESKKLQVVVIGSADRFQKDTSYVECINAKQLSEDVPRAEVLIQQLNEFQQVLEANGIKVYRPDYIGPFVPDQLTPRDIGFVLGDTFVFSNLSKKSRRLEGFGLINLLKDFDLSDRKVLIPPHDASIEGGDILIDKGNIYVGQSNRTNALGLEFIIQNFSDRYIVIPVKVNDEPHYSQYLHLDCVFNPVGSRHALYYPKGIGHLDQRISSNYELIEITEEEQDELGANMLTISDDLIIARKSEKLKRINTLLGNHYKVIEIDFDALILTGGSLRCASLPLIRG